MVSRYYARTAERHLRTSRRHGAFPLLTQTWEHHHPLGVVGVIAPWNYPLTLSISDAFPALAAGNAVVIKTDSQTPFSALAALEMLEEAGLPQHVLQVVTGSGSELGPELINRVEYRMFTGSTSVGRQVASQCSERLIPCSMELGGKNAMIVLADANLDRAAEGAERAMFSNAGQLCISMERLLVHEDVADEFQQKLVSRVGKMKLGAGLNYDYDMGSLISQDQLDTVREHVGNAVGQGAEVLSGGRPRPDLGPYFYEPTLLAGVRDGMELYADETFGPVLAVSRFASEEEAVRIANASRFGLNFSLWTRDTVRGRRMAARLQAGTVNINEGYIAAWGSGRRADGGNEGLRDGPASRLRRDPQVHRVPNGLGAAAAAAGTGVPDRSTVVGAVDHGGAEAAAAAWLSLGASFGSPRIGTIIALDSDAHHGHLSGELREVLVLGPDLGIVDERGGGNPSVVNAGPASDGEDGGSEPRVGRSGSLVNGNGGAEGPDLGQRSQTLCSRIRVSCRQHSELQLGDRYDRYRHLVREGSRDRTTLLLRDEDRGVQDGARHGATVC